MSAGDRVAILAQNSHRFLEAYWGLAKLGAIAVPLNFRLTRREMATLLEHSGACVLIAGGEYAEVAAELPGLRLVIGLDGGGDADSYESMLADAEADEPELGAGSDDPFAIMYTSGTTGLPKGAVVTHGNLESNIYNQAIADTADPADINLGGDAAVPHGRGVHGHDVRRAGVHTGDPRALRRRRGARDDRARAGDHMPAGADDAQHGAQRAVDRRARTWPRCG